MKVLMLILASDGGPKDIYTHFQYRSWKKYMHSHPDIEAYFYKANPDLTEDYYFEGDVLWVKCIEQYPRLWEKFILALAVFKSRLHEFDYIARPDLSTFLVLDRYLNFLRLQPRTNMCCAKELYFPEYSSLKYPSGACFTISSDLAIHMVKNTVNPASYVTEPYWGDVDDLRIGIYLHLLKIDIIPDKRIEIETPGQEINLRSFMFEKDRFCVRVAHHHHKQRLAKDMAIHDLLLSIFYPIC
jgi:hypothetical protein